ncbi:MAG: hypothetical protein ABW321_07245 [Polyangiales bacterium]
MRELTSCVGFASRLAAASSGRMALFAVESGGECGPQVRRLALQAAFLIAACTLPVLSACRDLKADPGYCETCVLDAGSSASSPGSSGRAGVAASGVSNQGVSAGGVGAASAGTTAAPSQPGAAGRAGTAPPATAGGDPKPAAGRGATAGVSGAAAGVAGTSAAPAGSGSSTGGASGGGASPASDAGTPTGGTGAPVDAGSSEPEPPTEPEPGEPEPPTEPEPCSACPSDTPACDATGTRCVQCTPDNVDACPGDRRACDPVTNTCVQCTLQNASACNGNTPVCDALDHTCVPCTGLDEGLCRSNNQVCDVSKRACVGCLTARPDSCRGDKPVCDEASATCVQCLPERPDVCSGERPLCLPETRSCVECITFNDCDEGRPRCDGGACQPCSSRMDCAAFPGKPVCGESGACEEEPEPPPTTMVGNCEACTSDAMCPTNSRCAPNPPGASVCLPVATNGACQQRLYREVLPIGGTPQVTVCAPPVSCEAIAATVSRAGCSTGQVCPAFDNICSAPANPSSCTYACADENECPDGFQCSQGDSLVRVCRPRR